MLRLMWFILVLACVSQPTVSQDTGVTYVSHTVYDYQFALPSGWAKTPYPDGVVYLSPFLSNGERCQITFFPKRAASGNLLNDAVGVYRSLFRTDPFTGYPAPAATLIRGTSAYGWEYLVLTKSTGGQAGDYASLIGAMVLVATAGKELAVIVGRSKDPLVSMCFGEIVRDEWNRFLYTLNFKGWNINDYDPKTVTRLLGSWTVASASVTDRLSFARNSRYASVAAASHRRRISSTEVLQTTDAFFGDGSYSVQGNAITMTADSDQHHSMQAHFRLEEESKDGGRTWNEQLCLLRKDIGHLCYQRDR